MNITSAFVLLFAAVSFAASVEEDSIEKMYLEKVNPTLFKQITGNKIKNQRYVNEAKLHYQKACNGYTVARGKEDKDLKEEQQKVLLSCPASWNTLLNALSRTEVKNIEKYPITFDEAIQLLVKIDYIEEVLGEGVRGDFPYHVLPVDKFYVIKALFFPDSAIRSETHRKAILHYLKNADKIGTVDIEALADAKKFDHVFMTAIKGMNLFTVKGNDCINNLFKQYVNTHDYFKVVTEWSQKISEMDEETIKKYTMEMVKNEVPNVEERCKKPEEPKKEVVTEEESGTRVKEMQARGVHEGRNRIEREDEKGY